MAVKTNYNVNGYKYFRVRLPIGKDKDGNDILKPFYGKSKTEAENKRDKWLEKKSLGLDQFKTINSLSANMYTWMWNIVKVSKIKETSFDRYEGIYRNYVEKSNIGYMIQEEIQRIDIQEYYTSLKEDGKSFSQVKNANKLINMYFSYAVGEGHILRNPCTNIDISQYKDEEIFDIDDFDIDDFEDEGDIETLSKEELKILDETIINEKLRIIVKFSASTGIRQGELIALKETDIRDMEVYITKTYGTVKVFQTPKKYTYVNKITPPKTKRSRRKVPLPSSLKKDLAILSSIRNLEKLKLGEGYRDNGLLFPSETGTYLDKRNLIRSWERALKKSGVPYKKFHSLRHTFATQLLENNVPLIRVSRLLGHASIKTTEIYVHILNETKQQDVETLSSLYA